MLIFQPQTLPGSSRRLQKASREEFERELPPWRFKEHQIKSGLYDPSFSLKFPGAWSRDAILEATYLAPSYGLPLDEVTQDLLDRAAHRCFSELSAGGGTGYLKAVDGQWHSQPLESLWKMANELFLEHRQRKFRLIIAATESPIDLLLDRSLLYDGNLTLEKLTGDLFSNYVVPVSLSGSLWSRARLKGQQRKAMKHFDRLAKSIFEDSRRRLELLSAIQENHPKTDAAALTAI